MSEKRKDHKGRILRTGESQRKDLIYPFDFKLVEVVPNDSQKRIAMTQEQQEIWMGFIRGDKTYRSITTSLQSCWKPGCG